MIQVRQLLLLTYPYDRNKAFNNDLKHLLKNNFSYVLRVPAQCISTNNNKNAATKAQLITECFVT